MVERRIELDRRYQRKKKMRKLKTRLAAASGADRDAILMKIKRISPWWSETPVKPSAETAKSEPKEPKEAKKKAPAKPKAEKKA